MTVITTATIGYTEVVDLSHNPVGRVFTMIIAVLGIGTFAYIFTNLTALMVEGELTKSFRRRMEMEIVGISPAENFRLVKDAQTWKLR